MAEEEQQEVKRGRGRPRKPVDPNAPPKEPKKRGRPTLEEAAAKKKAIRSANHSKAKLGKKNNCRKVITTRDILDANVARRTKRDGRLVEELSPREKAAIIYGLVYNPEATQYALWEMAVDYKSDDAAESTKKGYASRWYNSAAIVIFREQFMANYERMVKEKIDAALAVQKEELMVKFGAINPDDIDYTKPEAQKRLLNHLINAADDGRERLDALKAIVSMQKDDREAARDNKVQRFYMPIRCSQCPIYKKADKARKRRLKAKEALEEAKKAAEEAAAMQGETINEKEYEVFDDEDVTEEDLLPDEQEQEEIREDQAALEDDEDFEEEEEGSTDGEDETPDDDT
jgi:hypothetical protein